MNSNKLLEDIRADCHRYNKNYNLLGPISSHGHLLFYPGALAAKKIPGKNSIQIEQKSNNTNNNNYVIILIVDYNL